MRISAIGFAPLLLVLVRSFSFLTSVCYLQIANERINILDFCFVSFVTFLCNLMYDWLHRVAEQRTVTPCGSNFFEMV